MSNGASLLDWNLEVFTSHKFSSNHCTKQEVSLLETNLGWTLNFNHP